MDITERKTSEEALKFSQVRLDQVMETAGMAYWEINLLDMTLQANQRMYKLLETTIEEVGSYTISSSDYLEHFVHPEDREYVAQHLQQIVETNGAEKSGRMEFRSITATGGIIYAVADYLVAYDPEGQAVKIFGVLLNATDIKNAQQTLGQQATELATVAEVSLAVSSMQSMDELLEKVVSLTRSRFNLYHAHIFLLNEQNNILQMYACGWDENSHHSGLHEPAEIPLYEETALVARAARSGEVIVVNDVTQTPGWSPDPVLPEIAAELAVPLMAGTRLLGVLSVQSKTLNRFSEGSIMVQKTLAAQIAIAIQNTYQYQQTQAALENAEKLYAASEKIIESISPEELLDHLITYTTLNRFDRATILLFNKPWADTPPDFYQVKAVWQKSGLPSQAPVGTVYTNEQIPLTHLFSPKQPAPVFILNIETDRRAPPALHEAMQRVGMKSIALFPMVSGNQFIGGVTVQSAEMVMLSEEELRTIHSLIDEAAAVLQSWVLRQDLEGRLKELTSLQRNISREAWNAYQAAQPDESFGYQYDMVEVHPLAGNLSGEVQVTSSKALLYPLQVRGSIIGQVGVQQQDASLVTEEDVSFLEAMADQVSQAIERARLLEQTQKSATELQVVAEVSAAASGVLDPQELLQTVVDLAEKQFELYHAGIYLLENEILRLTAGSGEIGRKMQAQEWVLAGQQASVVIQAANSHRGHILNNVSEAIGYTSNPLLPDAASELAVPMIVGQQILGVLHAQSTRVNRFSEDDLRTFTTLATQTAIALQNARLFAEQAVTVEKLREVDHLKSTFLANMSHELRTPLNSILGFTQVIMEGLDGPLTDYMSTDLQLIEKNGQHLLNLINEILDMAKIESGRMNLVLEDVDVGELANEVMSTISAQASNKGLYLVNEIDSTLNLVIKADEIRLRQVLLNLFSNAIKFTFNGGVSVSAERSEQKVLLMVHDTGLGIPPDKLEMVFEPFTQVDTSTTRKVGGTGLGLPISRKLIEMHKGRLWVESNGIEGEGSIFKVELPA